MNPRRYVGVIVLIIVALVAAIVAANATFDPYGALDRRNDHAGLNHPHVMWQRFVREARGADTFVFGSSRANQLCADDVAALVPGARPFNFAIVGGMIHEHLAHLRSAVADGRRLRAVILLLDLQYFGAAPIAPQRDRRLHPDVAGTSHARTMFDYLTAVPTNASMRAMWRDLLGRPATPIWPCEAAAPGALQAAANADWTELDDDTQVSPFERRVVATRRGFDDALADLRAFAGLVRDRGGRLITLVSPMSVVERRFYRAADLEAALDRIRRITPVWRFGQPRWLSADAAHWSSAAHFQPYVARAMLARAVGHPSAPEGFGRLLSP